MARLISQVKGGFYAAAPEAVAAVLERLRPPDYGECLILDPCAGEGHGPSATGPQGSMRFPTASRLSEDRAAIVRESLPEGQALAPADFLRCAISYRSFSLIWCNPPYDYATGEEGRVESQFLERAFHLLAENGVLALVCPEDMPAVPDGRFLSGTILRDFGNALSAAVRKYNETDRSWAKSGSCRTPRIAAVIAGIGWIHG